MAEVEKGNEIGRVGSRISTATKSLFPRLSLSLTLSFYPLLSPHPPPPAGSQQAKSQGYLDILWLASHELASTGDIGGNGVTAYSLTVIAKTEVLLSFKHTRLVSL